MVLPNYFPDVWDEIATMQRWNAGIKNHMQVAESLSAINPQTGLTGYQHLSKIARVGPNLGPAAIPLAQAGVDPDTDPLISFAIKQQALMQKDRTGFGTVGRIYNPVAPGSGAAQYRLRNLVAGANAEGLIGEDGRLQEPDSTDTSDPKRWMFEEIRGAFMGAQRNLPYRDRQGNERVLRWSNRPSPVNSTNARQLHRMIESAEEPLNELRAKGIKPFTTLVSEDPSLAPYMEQAKSLGMIDSQGFLMDEDAAGPASFTTRVARKRFREDLSRIFFKYRKQDLPYRTMRGGTVKQASGGFQDVNLVAAPKQEEPGGPLGVVSDVLDVQRETSNIQAPSYARSGIGQDLWNTAVQGVQVGGAGMNAPFQEGTGLFRNFYAAATGSGDPNWGQLQSDLGVALQTGDWDMGNGTLVDPDSTVARERARREALRGEIDGQGITVGRYLAQPFGEPGDKSYDLLSGLVDFGLAVYADPAAIALRGAGKAQRLRTTIAPTTPEKLEAAGGIRGLARWVHGPTAQQLMDGDFGQAVTKRLSEISSPIEIARRLSYKLDPDLNVQIADSADPAEIRALLMPKLGTDFRTTSEVWSGPISTRFERPQSPTIARWAALSPDKSVQPSDRMGTARTMEAAGKTVRMDPETLDGHLNLILRARNRQEVENGVYGLMRATDGILDKHGVTNSRTRNGIIESYAGDDAQMRLWFGDEIGSDTPSWDKAVINGEDLPAGTVRPSDFSPHLAMQSLEDKIDLPDFQALKRLTSNPAFRIFTTRHSLWDTDQMAGDLRYPILGIKFIQDEIWKPITLARLAWTVRVIGEEQVRMAASPGIDGMLTHPLSYIAYRLSKKGEAGFGREFADFDEFREAMMQKRGGLLNDRPDRVRSNTRTHVYAKELRDPGYVNSWADNLVDYHRDPIAQRISDSNTVEEVMDWLDNDPVGQATRKKLSDITGVDYSNPAVMRAYVHKVQNNIHAVTGGNNDLLGFIRTGKLNEKSAFRRNGMVDNRSFRRSVAGYVDDHGPARVVGDARYTANPTIPTQLLQGKDAVVDFLFAKLMGNRTNNLSRSPYFRQSYWRRMAELAPYVSDRDRLRSFFDEASSTVREAADSTFVNRRTARRIEYQMSQVTDNTAAMVSFDQADLLARDFALQETKRRLFDLTQKQNWEESLSLIAPFISAWKEVFTSWGRLIKENPVVVRRGMQAYDAANRSGFFYKDETTGDLIFTYPGSEFLTKSLLDVPIPLTGKAEGLNFMAQIIPGIGPALQVPTVFFLADKPQYRDLYEKLVPFGAPAEQGVGEAFDVWNYAPPYLKRFIQGATASSGMGLFFSNEQDTRTYANSVMQVARYLASSGEYDLESPEDFQRLMDDAKVKADRFYLIRSLVQLGAPSAPAPRWLSETKSGELIPIAVLTEEYRRLQNEDFENADDIFLERFGDEVVLSMTPFSRTLSWGLDPSREFYDWSLEHPELRRKYPSIYGLFGPTGKFDIGVFAAQFEQTYEGKERAALTPDQWMRFSQHMIASRLYEKEQTYLGDEKSSRDGQDYLRSVRDWLHEQYPGWRNFRAMPGGVESDAALRELRNAVADPELADNSVVRTTREYLDERDSIMEEMADRDMHSFSNQGAQGARDYLLDLGSYLATQDPGFDRVFDMVLSRELRED